MQCDWKKNIFFCLFCGVMKRDVELEFKCFKKTKIVYIIDVEKCLGTIIITINCCKNKHLKLV